MNFATLVLMAPLATGFHPGKAARCDTAACAPAAAPSRNYLNLGMPGAVPPPLIAQPCPALPPAPLLAVKFVAPNGVRVTTSPGSAGSKMFPAPATFGFRPGYIYRVELGGLPNRPDETLYPEIEVRGSLAPRPGMNYMEYPATINLSDLDIAKASAGSLITKVVYLEDPTKAVPVKTTADRPLEQFADQEDEAIRAAADSGRIVMIVRIGNRKPTDKELQTLAVEGTILGPGEMSLGRPAAAPPLAWCGVQLYDPISGPKPFLEECLTDGGDTKNRLGIRDGGKLGGLDSTDVSLEYTSGEKRKVATSNTVCICVPRFAVQRVEVNPNGLYFAYRLEAGIQRMATSSARANSWPNAVTERLKPVGLELPIRPMQQVSRQGAEVLRSLTAVKAVYKVDGVQVVKSSVEPDEIVNFPNEMIVTKSVEPANGVKIGDEVTFTIKFRNDTTKPVSDLVLSDSLSPRLEYVPGSAQSDLPTNVTTQPNADGSVVVRFEIPGTLEPGQAGLVKFKAKVR